MSREKWLEERKKGIGGSEASSLVGSNPYKTNVELWEEKTGRRIAEDIGHKDYVRYGIDSEGPLRELFKLDYPHFTVSYNEFLLHKNPKYPFLFATLDGEILDQNTGEKGVLEIKATNIMAAMHSEKWKDRIPDNYYIQILHQLLVTGWDFAILKAHLKTEWGDEIRIQTKHYTIRADDVQLDMDYLLQQEVRFWNQYVLTDIRPSLVLPNI